MLGDPRKMHSNLVALIVIILNLVIGEEGAKISGNRASDAEPEHHPRIRHGNESRARPIDGGYVSGVFIDFDESENHLGSGRSRKIAAPVPGIKTTTESGIFDYFGRDEEDEEEDGEEEDDAEEEEEEEEDKDEEEDEGEEEEEYDDDGNRPNAGKKPPFVRGVRRKYVRAHKIIFPLLLAYKLKFFTLLPLLVGSLVLLVATTGLAGFFFALFSAALGLNVKAHQHLT